MNYCGVTKHHSCLYILFFLLIANLTQCSQERIGLLLNTMFVSLQYMWRWKRGCRIGVHVLTLQINMGSRLQNILRNYMQARIRYALQGVAVELLMPKFPPWGDGFMLSLVKLKCLGFTTWKSHKSVFFLMESYPTPRIRRFKMRSLADNIIGT